MKKIILGLVSALIATTSFSQSLSHELGGGGIIFTGASLPSLFYAPRYNFKEMGENATLSVGSNLGIGMQFQSSQGTGTGSSSGFFNIHVPVLAQFNFGNKCNPDNEEVFGFFLGAGGALNYTTMSSGGSSGSGSMYGPEGTGGIKLHISDYDLGARFSYLLDLSSNKLSVMAINLFTTF